jgi:hypothetical protein
MLNDVEFGIGKYAILINIIIAIVLIRIPMAVTEPTVSRVSDTFSECSSRLLCYHQAFVKGQILRLFV